MQVLGQYSFGWMLPRTAREQYATFNRISKDDLKEGDLVFFNTTGGVSHVGMYLQNGKFIHSSTTNGVAISSLDEAYWKARFIGARRSPDQQKMIGVLNTGVN
jgi:lipoprotein Spr